MTNKDKLATVYDQYRGRLGSWLASKAGADEAEDLLHDVFANAFANLDSLEPVRDVAAWLWRIAANALRDHWRSSARKRRRMSDQAPELDDIVADAGYDHADLLHRERILAALKASIRNLPPEQRMIVEAQSLGDESFRSVSARTGIPVDTLSSRKRYALAKIRSDLSIFYEEDNDAHFQGR